MINYKLDYRELIERDLHRDFKVEATENPTVIQECIDYFNSEVEWDEMFNITDALERIKNGDRFFVGYYKDTVVGYCWIKAIDRLNYHLYNLFMRTTQEPRKYGATDLCYLVIRDFTVGTVTMSADEWNLKSQKVIQKLGFKVV